MFRRFFGGDKPEEQVEQPASEQEAAPPVVAHEPVAAPAVKPVTPPTTQLFSRVEELDTEAQRIAQAEAAAQQRRSGGLRRWFAGEERDEQEIQREVQKTTAAVQKTRGGMFGQINELFRSDEPINAELWEELEEVMIASDVGVDTTDRLIERVKRKVERQNLRRASEARSVLKEEMVKLLNVDVPQYSERSTRPYVVLVIGVNGVGKTTLIAKVANRYQRDLNRNVILAAADTFRAAAVEQLQTWADRVGVPMISQGQGADPGAVAFDAVNATYARDADILIIDTAGRLQSKYNLMQELQKIRNVVRKRVEWAPHEVLLVIDATTGQNGIQQARAFMEVADVTHLALTKLDSTAKGGVAFAMVQEIERPIKYIGTGEKVDDLALFDPQTFVDALFE
jgi:fused signal recognition particle receptor